MGISTTQNFQASGLNRKITGYLEKYPVILQFCRFGAIGLLNFTIDVLVLNFLSARFGITKGTSIGLVNLPGFVLAVIQSYYWNKYWAFGSETVSLFKNFFRLIAVGLLGVIIYGLIVLGAHNFAQSIYYSGIFIIFTLAQLILWYVFGFFKRQSQEQSQPRFYFSFFAVSAIGFVINSLALYVITTHLLFLTNSGDNLNLAKIIATIASLVWNFIGYKLIVFKK